MGVDLPYQGRSCISPISPLRRPCMTAKPTCSSRTSAWSRHGILPHCDSAQAQKPHQARVVTKTFWNTSHRITNPELVGYMQQCVETSRSIEWIGRKTCTIRCIGSQICSADRAGEVSNVRVEEFVTREASFDP